MSQIIDINNEKDNLLALERASWEKECREELLLFLIKQNLTESKDYTRLWSEYLNAYSNYNQEKKRFFNQVVSKYLDNNYDNTQWEVQFNEGVLILR